MASATVPEEGNVLVVVRVRPLSQQEQEGNQHRVVQVVDPSVLVLNPEEPEPTRNFAGVRVQEPPKRKTREQKFVFDHVFGEAAGQQEVFQHITKDILDGVLNGCNCSVFAYGATGAGKTHTMLGDERDPGIMYLTMIELYRRMEEQEDKRYEVLISYLEVYNEQIQDLLEPQGPLAIREDPQKGVVVQGLSFHQPDSAEHLLQMLARGNRNRTQHPTDANASSSRSHAVFQVYVKQQGRVPGLSQDFRVAKMSLIDLAGSERASSTNARGERLREGSSINRSLLALINVINALADAKSRKSHVPYRDSKLTRLLKDSIGGNCRTVMIAAISPSSRSYDDTYNTLRYANRAKQIKLSPKSNVVSVDCHMSNYAAVCEQLKAEITELREKLKAYENSQGPAVQKNGPRAQATFRLKKPLQKRLPGCESEGTEQLTEMDQVGLWLQGEEKQESPLSSCCCSLKGRNSLLLGKHEHKSVKAARGRLDYIQMEMLLGVLLKIVRKQHCALEGTGLCTPEMTMEIEEVESLLKNDGCVKWKEWLEAQDTRTEPIKPSKIAPKQNTQLQPEKVMVLRHKPQKRHRRDLSLSPNTPLAPLKKRWCSDSSAPFGARCTAALKLQAKQPNSALSSKCVPFWMSDKSADSEGGSSFKRVTGPLRSASPCTPKLGVQETPTFCSSTVTKRRKPLATSALQNSASVQTVPAAPLAVQDMNTTFDVLEENNPVAFNASPILCWENVCSNQKDAGSTFSSGSKIAVFAAKGPPTRLLSSTPRLHSSITRCSTKKRQCSSIDGFPEQDCHTAEKHHAETPAPARC
uniref:Kinesin-like protein n=1 Tax=Geotrypetes seraphini TaxID=260995 RepID=A0A6P8SE28_GEOSA|nr:kinesin-like protein KIF18B isoform X2 [Geotrypetes seraphini]